MACYIAGFAVLTVIIASGYHDPMSNTVHQSVSVAQSPTVNNATDDSEDKPSLDEVVSTDVAASIAERANLPIAPTIASRAVSLNVKTELAQTDDAVVSKPQIVEVKKGQREVKHYKVKKGDSVETLSKKFNISSNTIKWANNLQTDALRVGSKVKIPPVSGIIYKVEKGDSVKNIAKQYKTSVDRIVSFNDLELKKPKAGQTIIIPSGVLPKEDRPGYVAPTPAYGGGMDGSGYSVVNKNLFASAGNKYAPGNCTWYAYERRKELGRPIGSFWGDGGSWAYSARAAGYEVNSTPRPGAIQVMLGYPGHVAIVESVKDNGDIGISEMNYAGNFNRVTTRSMTAGQAGTYLYVHDRK